MQTTVRVSDPWDSPCRRGEMSHSLTLRHGMAEFRFRITFWKSPPGQTYFSVNDGPLRGASNDPADEAFLKAIRDDRSHVRRSRPTAPHYSIAVDRRCPDELMAQAMDKDPVVDLVDKTTEEYKEPPKPKYIKFSGDGMSLGGGCVRLGTSRYDVPVGSLAVTAFMPAGPKWSSTRTPG